MTQPAPFRPGEDPTLPDVLGPTGVGTWWWDRAAGVVRWDEHLERLFGLPAGGFPGTFEAWVDLLHPDDRPRVLEAVERGVASGRGFRFDHRCVWPNGSVHWIEGRGAPRFDRAGCVVGAQGIALTIDHRHATEAERERLLKQEQEARAYAEAISEHLIDVQRVTALLASVSSTEEIARILLEESMRVTGATAGALSLREDDALSIRTVLPGDEQHPLSELDCLMSDPTPLAEAARTGAPVRTDDVLALPLTVEGHTRGVLTLVPTAEQAFEAVVWDYLETLTGLGASAVVRAEAVRAEQLAAERIARLEELTGAALLRLPLETGLEEFLRRTATIVGYDVGRLMVLSGDGQFLEEKAQWGLGPDAEPVRIPRGKGMAGRVAEAGHPMVFPDTTEIDVYNPRVVSLVRSAAGVPLLDDDGDVCGVLDVGSYTHRSFEASDLSLLELAAERLSAALARSRAYEIERRERERSEYLNRIGDILIRPTSVRATADAIADAAVPRLADWAVVMVLDDEEHPHISSAGTPSVQATLDRATAGPLEYQPDLPVGVPETLRSGREQLVTEIDAATLAHLSRDPAIGQLAAELSLQSMIVVPLHGLQGVVGAIQLARQVPGPAYGEHDLALAREVAARVGVTLESARTRDRQREIATTLQRSLLPVAIPDVRDVDIAARYWPADEAADVGGDFFDVFSLDEDRWGVLIGDVSGKGVEAAALTGIARHTARAAARHSLPPVTTLHWIHDAYLEDTRLNHEYCTALFGMLEQRHGELTFTFGAGGHPLPIHRGRHSGSAQLVGRNGSALGLMTAPTFFEQSIALAPGEWLLLYTDGITDIPKPRPMMDDELLALVDDATNTSDVNRAIENIEAALRRRNGPRWRTDDTVLLLIRRRETPPQG